MVPPGAWDTHLHIFEPEKFPYASSRHYTPSSATFEQCKQFKSSLAVENICIAHGLAYGSDCTSLLHYLECFGGKARGICVIDVEAVTDDLLNIYHVAGVRSARLDFFKHKAMHSVDNQISLIESMASRLVQWGNKGWSIQIQQPHIEFWGRLRVMASELPVPLVVDHFALIRGESMRNGDAESLKELLEYAELLGALRDGNVWIKLSAPYRCSNLGHTYDDLEDHVRAMIEANPDRVLWGSDWPHTQRHEARIGKDPGVIESFQDINNEAWIQSLGRWLSESQWQKMWVSNPQRLYEQKSEGIVE